MTSEITPSAYFKSMPAAPRSLVAYCAPFATMRSAWEADGWDVVSMVQVITDDRTSGAIRAFVTWLSDHACELMAARPPDDEPSQRDRQYPSPVELRLLANAKRVIDFVYTALNTSPATHTALFVSAVGLAAEAVVDLAVAISQDPAAGKKEETEQRARLRALLPRQFVAQGGEDKGGQA